MSFPMSFFDPVMQPLVISTAQHNKAFKWLGLDNAKIVAYGFYATTFDTVEIFCLNLLTKKFRKCLTIKFTNPTNNEELFARRNLSKFLYSAAISEDGQFIGIVQSVRHLGFINLIIISLKNGEIIDKYKLVPSVEIASESRYKCRLKNLLDYGWILHYERDDKRKYYQIVLDKFTKTADLKVFTEVNVDVLKEFDDFIRYDFSRILVANDKSVVLNYIPNTNAFPTYDFAGKLDVNPLVSHVCFFPFKQDSDSDSYRHSTFAEGDDEIERYRSCGYRAIHILDILKKLKFSGAYFMYVNASNKLHVTIGSRCVPKWRVGQLMCTVQRLEHLAACQLFSCLHNGSKRISETRTERLGLNPLLIRKYFGPVWLRKEISVDIPVL